MTTVVPKNIAASMDRAAGRDVICEDCKISKADRECWDCAAQLCHGCSNKNHATLPPCCGRCDRKYRSKANRPYKFGVKL